MDSLSHLALGAAIGVAVMGRRTAAWKAALWGAVCNTLPDLDVFIDHGDAVRNMTMHRGASHALWWQTLASPFIALAIAAVHRQRPLLWRWWLAVWLALVSHPLLDVFTVYGTQLARPFNDEPFSIGSLFIIDPLVTLPLLLAVGASLRRPQRGVRWCTAALALSTAYVGWSAVAQQQARGVALASLRAQGIAAQRLLVTPTPFNTVLWRVVAVDGDTYHEGFYSLLDAAPRVAFSHHPRGVALLQAAPQPALVQQLERFSHGLLKAAVAGDELRLSDLRMGQEPTYVFTFAVARRAGGAWVAMPPAERGHGGDLALLFRWLGPRLLGRITTPPPAGTGV